VALPRLPEAVSVPPKERAFRVLTVRLRVPIVPRLAVLRVPGLVEAGFEEASVRARVVVARVAVVWLPKRLRSAARLSPREDVTVLVRVRWEVPWGVKALRVLRVAPRVAVLGVVPFRAEDQVLSRLSAAWLRTVLAGLPVVRVAVERPVTLRPVTLRPVTLRLEVEGAVKRERVVVVGFERTVGLVVRVTVRGDTERVREGVERRKALLRLGVEAREKVEREGVDDRPKVERPNEERPEDERPKADDEDRPKDDPPPRLAEPPPRPPRASATPAPSSARIANRALMRSRIDIARTS
jgi:hypothetical protein